MPTSASRIVDDPAAAAAQVASWRGAGERVVFTNGCFDLLHVGHVTYLAQARQLGDRLVVGINDDASVARLKGPTRPIQTLADRSVILAALRAVDLVVPFSTDTPLQLIAALQPAVLVKGGDYAFADIVGASEVVADGGHVEVLPFVAGRSTSALIDRLAGGS